MSDTTIARLVADPSGKGKHRLNYSAGAGKKKRIKPESDWVWLDIEPIVADEIWNHANAILEEVRQSPRKPLRKTRHLFAGLVFCQCGSKMHVPSRNPKYVCSACKNKIPVDDLETVFREQLKGYLVDPTEIATYVAQANDQIQEKSTLVDATQLEIAKLTSDLDKIMALYLSGQLPQDSVAERYKPVEARRNQLRDELPRLMGELDFLKISAVSSDDMIREAQDLYGNWTRLDPEDKRRIVEQITDGITIARARSTSPSAFVPQPRKS